MLRRDFAPLAPVVKGSRCKSRICKSLRKSRARVHLEAAVTRLEHVATTVGPAELARELQGLKDENADLKSLTATVTKRLDVAIVRLRAIVGE